MKKQYSLLAIVAILSFFSIYYLNLNHSHTHINIGNSPDMAHLKKSNTEQKNSESKVLREANSKTRIYYSTSSLEKTIGSLKNANSKVMLSQMFQIFVDKFEANHCKVWLEYDLFGVADYTSVSKSINDQLATGGTYVKKQATWSKQRELIQPEQLREGRNIIRFNIPEDAEYSYKVKNVAIKVEPNSTIQPRSLTINQPGTFTYYQKYGYIQGFVSGKGYQKAKLTVNGKPQQAANGLFENLVEKDNFTSEVWSATVVAQFEDGEKITQTVFFNKSEPFDYNNNLISQIHRSEKTIVPEAPINLKHDGISITGETQTIENPITISATTLRAIDMAPMGSGMVNVTGLGKGYRMLPHISKFQRNLTIRMKYDSTMLPVGYKPEDIRTYYFDETANNWIVLPLDTIDKVNSEIVSYTNHFTDFINAIIKAPELPETQAFTPTSMKDLKAANPLEGYNVINPPSANNMGTANLSFPIEVPKGRLGMQPNLSINYNSGGGNSWLGVGWNLSAPSITVETRWGVPRYDSQLETESYLLNGEELIPEVQRTGFSARTTDKQFYPKVEGAFSKIIRHGNSPSTYYWTVTDKNGVESTFGDNRDSSCLTDANGNIAHWALTKVKDVNGNFVSYKYQIMSHAGVANGTNPGKQIYLKKIIYTNFDNVEDGKYWVDFNLEDIGTVLRPDIQISARNGLKEVTAHRLKNIVVSSNWGIIRKYHMVYKEGAFNKTLLCRIVEEDASSCTINSEPSSKNLECDDRHSECSSVLGLKKHTFEYYEDINSNHFSSEVTINSTDDQIGSGTVYSSDATTIGATKTKAHSYGGGIDLGLGMKIFNKNNGLGGNYDRSISESEGVVALLDINGDGLPDKVYKNNNGSLYYRKLIKENNSFHFSTTPYQISSSQSLGILKEKTTTNSWGIEGHIGFSADAATNGSGCWSNSDTKTSVYFADANADGYVDIVSNGTVYFNQISTNGEPSFISSLSDTIYMGSCNYIVNSATINDSVTIHSVLNDKPFTSSNDTLLQEAVRLWIAPYTGRINIKAPIALIEDTSYIRTQSHYVDGIRYTVQKNDSEQIVDSIGANYYNPRDIAITNDIVTKGDRFYFRLQSKNNRSFDNVKWDPKISYTGIGHGPDFKTLDTTRVDADDKKIYIFRASEDFLLNAKEKIGMPLCGNVKLRGTISSLPLSDTVRFQIYKNNTLYKEKVFIDDTSINYSLDTIFSVDTTEILTFYLKSNTQVNWSGIKSSFLMYYTYCNDPSIPIDTNVVIAGTDTFYTNIRYRPIVQYSLYQDDMIASTPCTTSTGTFSATPQLTFSTTNANGNIVFAIKRRRHTLAKKVLTIQNGVIQNNTPIQFSNSNLDKIYFEYYTDSVNLARKITIAKAQINSSNYAAGVHATITDTLLKFGNLYRNWGQFCYKPDDYTLPIDESKLVLNQSYQDTSFISNFDTTALHSPGALQDYINSNNLIDPLNNTFNMMMVDMDSMVWRGFGDITAVGPNFMSNIRKPVSVVSEDVDYPIPVSSETRITAILKHSKSASTSSNYAIGPSSATAGSSTTNTQSEVLLDYMDLNGDRYPDIVGTDYTQFSNPLGGLNPNVTSSGEVKRISENEATCTGATFGASYPKNENPPANDPKTSKRSVKGSGSISLSQTDGSDNATWTLLDINGDGLPDKVSQNGQVQLNLGYGYAPEENWVSGVPRSGNSVCSSYTLGGGLQFNLWETSLSGGIGITSSQNRNKRFLVDVNGDGLQDIVRWNINATTGNNEIWVSLNNGSGFLPEGSTAWGTFDNAMENSNSYNESVNLTFTVGFVIPIPLCPMKLLINPKGLATRSFTKENVQLSDINDDGYLDYANATDESNIKVRFSTLGKVNLLKKVSTPTGSNFNMDYTMSENSQKSPNRNWELASVNVFDNHNGDGANNSLNTFQYKNPYYDRFERASFGYDTVITRSHDTRNNNAVYRTVLEIYHNSDFLFKGLKKYEALLDRSNNKFVETVYTYKHKRISTGEEVSDDSLQCFGDYYPAISREDKYFYEGASSSSIHTQKLYTHGNYGNVVEYEDKGDLDDVEDDYRATIEYHFTEELNLLALASRMDIYHNSTLLRSKSAEYDNLGRLITLNLSNNGDNSTIRYFFDSYGNIESVEQPIDDNGNHKFLFLTYDSEVYTYPVQVMDESNFQSSATYDYRIGKPLSNIDVSGNALNYTYYPDGRIKTIQAPYETQANIPFTIKFDYWNNRSHMTHDPDSIPWARTLHYDPANANNMISTVLFSDGLGRAIQTKKKSVINDTLKMVVSGKINFDAFGRTDSTWYPITEGLSTDSIFNPNIDNQKPSVTTYDIMDRTLISKAPDQTSTSMSYGFGSDKYGTIRFKTSQTDALGNITQLFKDPRGLQTTVIDALNGYTAFTYSPLGELLSSTDPEGNQTTYLYDGLGRKIQTVHPDAGTSNFTYDKANNLISMQTQNLVNQSLQINYKYNFNKLTEIHYPNNPEMDVYYKYGESTAGDDAGRIIKQQDASGVQIFEYGKLGELTRNIHTFVMPGGENYTFVMDWKYDSWNRLQQIDYPDGEQVYYHYNNGGQLISVHGTKTTRSYDYINNISYDKFGNRLEVRNGNGTDAIYTYNPTSLRLSNLTSHNVLGEVMQNINYTYDSVSNITQIANTASVMSNGLGGSSVYHYQYDNLYRLDSAQGNWKNNNTFSLAMQYSASGNILNKAQFAETSINGTPITTSYDRAYKYNTSQPHTINSITGNIGFEWDANGNMTRYSDNDLDRYQCWDEENRIMAIGDNHYLSNYIYDAAGERVWKLSGQKQQMLVNGEEYVNFADLNENKTLYTSPYMVVNDREYTKHYYIEGQRIASKIGGGLAPSITTYDDETELITGSYKSVSASLLNMCHRADYCTGFDTNYIKYGTPLVCLERLSTQDSIELDLYFYHSDHIGSSSFITDRTGIASQHLQYLPFGELFVEQRSTANYYTPYKFSGKEKDEETSYSYFGARYYMSDVSIWLSVDPMRDKYPNMSPYNYCHWNPIKLIDPDGMDDTDFGVTSSGKVRQIGPTNNEPDKLYAIHDDGTIITPVKPIIVNDKELLPALSIDRKNVSQEDAEGNKTEQGILRYSSSNDVKDVANVFKFVSSNSNKEWCVYTAKNQSKKYTIGTFQFENLAPSSEDFGIRMNDVSKMIHSHFAEINVKDQIASMWGDKSLVKQVPYQYMTFFPKTVTLYNLNRNGNFKSSKINSIQNLINSIK